MLSDLTLPDLDGGINLVDVGAAGALGESWKPLHRFLNVYAFEANAEAAEHLRRTPHEFASLTVIAAAVADGCGRRTVFQTQSPWNWSLLEPDSQWIRRFTYAPLFEITGTSELETVSLAEVDVLRPVDVDAIKCDSQGLELPILRSAGDMLRRVFLVEAETGLVRNYHGETTFSELSKFLEDEGFLLFHLDHDHCVGRANVLGPLAARKQPLWCESHWLRDACGSVAATPMTRAKALKSLLLCAHLGAIDYGLELAGHYAQHGLLTTAELARLSIEDSWRLIPIEPQAGPPPPRGVRRLAISLLSLIPARLLASGSQLLEQASRRPNPLRKLPFLGLQKRTSPNG